MNVPFLMVMLFLLLTLIVGFYFSISNKIISLREYAVGKKEFSTATLVATVLATGFGGGGLIRTVEQIHKVGLYWILLVLICSYAPYLILGKLTLRMASYMQHLSIAETIGKVYGKYPRLITALSGICYAIAGTAIQIRITSLAISICIDTASISPKQITLGATSILIFYSAFGGIRAVSFTDVLQFLTFSIIIPFLTWFMFQSVDKTFPEALNLLVSHPKFHCHFDIKLVAILSLALSGILVHIGPQFIQRVYMASGPIQARKVFFYTSIFSFLIMASISMIGLFVFISAPNLPQTEIWEYIMQCIPSMFKGLLCISLLAMSMSTADSLLNTCAVMVSHDIIEVIKESQKLRKIFSLRILFTSNLLWLAKSFTVVVGICAMMLTFRYKDLLSLLTFSFALSVPMVVAPFLLAIYGFRSSSCTALIGMATGALTIGLWKRWIEPTTGIDGSFFCMLANGLAMLAAHYLLPQSGGSGWVPPDKEFQQIQQEKVRIKRRRIKAILEAVTHKKAFLARLQPTQPKLLWIGGYLTFTGFFTLLYYLNTPSFRGYYLVYPIMVLLISLSLILYAIFSDLNRYPAWITGSYWLVASILCLSLHSIYNT